VPKRLVFLTSRKLTEFVLSDAKNSSNEKRKTPKILPDLLMLRGCLWVIGVKIPLFLKKGEAAGCFSRFGVDLSDKLRFSETASGKASGLLATTKNYIQIVSTMWSSYS
jgi:hypothetical protein